MEVRCPVPAQAPCSPLGYQVVEIADEQAPVPRVRPPAHGRRGQENTSNPPRLPWSPLGYAVVQVAEEGAQSERRRLLLSARAPRRPLPRHQRPPLYATVIAASGMSLVALLIALIAAAQPNAMSMPAQEWASRPTAAPNAPEAAAPVRGRPVQPPVAAPQVRCRPQGLFQVRIPEVDPPAAEEKAEPLPTVVQDEAKPDGICPAPAERATFGTAVQFARNPQEAARTAQAEHKLTFLLHVSGNFEDDRFT